MMKQDKLTNTYDSMDILLNDLPVMVENMQRANLLVDRIYYYRDSLWSWKVEVEYRIRCVKTG